MLNCLAEIIKSRRSVSEFSEKKVSKEMLDELIELASFAPSSTNIQPWFFVIFQTAEKQQKLHSFIANGYEKTKQQLLGNHKLAGAIFSKVLEAFGRYGKFDQAPIYLLVFARPYDKSGLAQIIKATGNEKLLQIANESAKTSVAMAMQNFLLLAHAKGLATRVKDGIKFFLNDEQLKAEFYAEFEIPKDYALVSGIQLGFQKEGTIAKNPSPRLPLEKIRKYV